MNQSRAMTERLEALGKFLRFHRRERGLTQDDAAGAVGVSKNTVSQIERGQQWPSMQTYLRLLDVLELSDYDATDLLVLDGHRRRRAAARDMGLDAWWSSLNDTELRYGLSRAWEGIELMREMERRGLEHPFRRMYRRAETLDLLAPEEIEERTQRAYKGIAQNR
jgi:transcriptional regulator with XRE-family HTH domain